MSVLYKKITRIRRRNNFIDFQISAHVVTISFSTWDTTGGWVKPSSSGAQNYAQLCGRFRIGERYQMRIQWILRWRRYQLHLCRLHPQLLHQCSKSFNFNFQTSWILKPANSMVMKIENVGSSLKSTKDEIEILIFTINWDTTITTRDEIEISQIHDHRLDLKEHTDPLLHTSRHQMMLTYW